MLVPPPRCKRRLSAPAALPPITANPARRERGCRRLETRLRLAALLDRLADTLSSGLSLTNLLRASFFVERGGFCSLMLFLQHVVFTYVFRLQHSMQEYKGQEYSGIAYGHNVLS